MTRLDSARETAGRTRDAMAPYAASAKDTAMHYADEARLRIGPALEALGPKAAAAGVQARHGATQAAYAAKQQYDKLLAPQLAQAFSNLPPDTQKATLKAVHRAQEAALAAKISAARAAGQARTTVVPRVTEAVENARTTVTPLAQEAQVRGAAALTALHGHVTAAEISDLAAKNIKKEQRHGWATGLAVAGTIAIGTGVLAWQWWRKQSNPEWLVEPPVATASASPTAGAHAAGSEAALNGSTPRDPVATETAKTPEPSGPKPTPKPAPPPSKPGGDDRPKPHDPRKPH